MYQNVVEELLTENKIKPENADEYTAFYREHVVQRSFSVITEHISCKKDIPMYTFLSILLNDLSIFPFRHTTTTTIITIKIQVDLEKAFIFPTTQFRLL